MKKFKFNNDEKTILREEYIISLDERYNEMVEDLIKNKIGISNNITKNYIYMKYYSSNSDKDLNPYPENTKNHVLFYKLFAKHIKNYLEELGEKIYNSVSDGNPDDIVNNTKKYNLAKIDYNICTHLYKTADIEYNKNSKNLSNNDKSNFVKDSIVDIDKVFIEHLIHLKTDLNYNNEKIRNEILEKELNAHNSDNVCISAKNKLNVLKRRKNTLSEDNYKEIENYILKKLEIDRMDVIDLQKRFYSLYIELYDKFFNDDKHIKENDQYSVYLYEAIIELSDCYKRKVERDKEFDTLCLILRKQIPKPDCLNKIGDIFLREEKYHVAIYWFEQTLEMLDSNMELNSKEYFISYISSFTVFPALENS